MSFFDSASLVTIPSGVKDGVLYSVKPIDGSGDLTFSRGSDIEATRVNANGYIEKAQVNLLLQSNQFDTTWVTYDTSVTGGQSGYDGTSDAWLLAITGATGFQTIRQTVSGTGVQTFSIYAKAGTLNWIRFTFAGGAAPTNYYNIADGTLGSIGGGEASIVSVGGGWYRCSASFDGTFTELRIYPATDNNNPNQSSGNIYIQDAQINYGLVAQTYQETTTAAVVSGITDNMPRLNYDPANPTCPSLLLEPSRTNEIPNSEYLSAWGASNVSVTQNTAISPEGVQNASTIEVTTQTALQGLAQGFVADGTSYYTISGYYKKTATSQRAQLKIRDFLGSGTTYGFVDLDLSSGSVLASIGTYSVTSFNSDWWYIQVTTASVPSAGIRRAVIRLDNQTVGTQVTAYGIMVEKGTYATSYIPTYGSSATRTDEVCDKTGIASLIGQTEGTIFIQVESNEHISELSDGTTNNRIVIYTDGNNYVRNLIRSGGSMSSNIQTNTTIQAGDKIALAYANNDSVIYKNGVQIGSDTTVTIPATSKVNVGSDYNGNSSTINSVNQFILFPTRLTNAQLAELTA